VEGLAHEGTPGLGKQEGAVPLARLDVHLDAKHNITPHTGTRHYTHAAAPPSPGTSLLLGLACQHLPLKSPPPTRVISMTETAEAVPPQRMRRLHLPDRLSPINAELVFHYLIM